MKRQTYAMRLGDDERQVIQEAAALCGFPLSQYIRIVALEAANKDIAAAHPGATGHALSDRDIRLIAARVAHVLREDPDGE